MNKVTIYTTDVQTAPEAVELPYPIWRIQYEECDRFWASFCEPIIEAVREVLAEQLDAEPYDIECRDLRRGQKPGAAYSLFGCCEVRGCDDIQALRYEVARRLAQETRFVVLTRLSGESNFYLSDVYGYATPIARHPFTLMAEVRRLRAVFAENGDKPFEWKIVNKWTGEPA